LVGQHKLIDVQISIFDPASSQAVECEANWHAVLKIEETIMMAQDALKQAVDGAVIGKLEDNLKSLGKWHEYIVSSKVQLFPDQLANCEKLIADVSQPPSENWVVEETQPTFRGSGQSNFAAALPPATGPPIGGGSDTGFATSAVLPSLNAKNAVAKQAPEPSLSLHPPATVSALGPSAPATAPPLSSEDSDSAFGVDYEPDDSVPPPDEAEFRENIADADSVNTDAFRPISDAIADLLSGNDTDSPEERLGLSTLETTKDIFPDFLRPTHVWDHLGISDALTSVRQIKARGFEMVRYRNINPETMNVEVQGRLAQLSLRLRRAVSELREAGAEFVNQLGELYWDAPPDFVSGGEKRFLTQKQFLDEGWSKSLQVTKFKQNNEEGEMLRGQYGQLVSHMPQCAMDKLGDLPTPESRFAALTNLANKHSGELVVLDVSRDGWRLQEVSADFFQWDWGEQFWCLDHGHEVGDAVQTWRQWVPVGPCQQEVLDIMSMDREIVANAKNLNWQSLSPAWGRMKFRHICPCEGVQTFAWFRTSMVVSLGAMFMLLGKEVPAAQIYSLYRTLRIVVLKRRKAKCGYSWVGNAVSGMAAASIRESTKQWRDLLIEEYATLRGQALPVLDDKRACEVLYHEAIQYVHVNLLQDLSPPWVGHQFSQALPGDGVLCRYLKPTFLRWSAGMVPVIFGQQVFQEWTQKCHQVGLPLAALVARPLYVCVGSEDGEFCGRIAAMSPLMEQREKHRHFFCKVCARQHQEQHQVLPVYRLLRLYAMVLVQDKQVAMRTTPMHIVIHAPKDDSVWGVGHNAPTEALVGQRKPLPLPLPPSAGHARRGADTPPRGPDHPARSTDSLAPLGCPHVLAGWSDTAAECPHALVRGMRLDVEVGVVAFAVHRC